jgi:hypothetical protein
LNGIQDPEKGIPYPQIGMKQTGENEFFLSLVLYDDVHYEIFVGDSRKYVGMEQDPGQISFNVGMEIRVNGYLLEMTSIAPQWPWAGYCRFTLKKGVPVRW